MKCPICDGDMWIVHGMTPKHQCQKPTGCLDAAIYKKDVKLIAAALAAAHRRGWEQRGERDAGLCNSTVDESGSYGTEIAKRIIALPYEPAPEPK